MLLTSSISSSVSVEFAENIILEKGKVARAANPEAPKIDNNNSFFEIESWLDLSDAFLGFSSGVALTPEKMLETAKIDAQHFVKILFDL